MGVRGYIFTKGPAAFPFLNSSIDPVFVKEEFSCPTVVRSKLGKRGKSNIFCFLVRYLLRGFSAWGINIINFKSFIAQNRFFKSVILLYNFVIFSDNPS